MNTIKIKSSRIIELELQIKLLDYLKNTKEIEESMYAYVVNKLLLKIKQETKNHFSKKENMKYKWLAN